MYTATAIAVKTNIKIDFWQSVFPSKSSWEYEERRFRLEGTDRRHERGTQVSPQSFFVHTVLLRACLRVNLCLTLTETSTCQQSFSRTRTATTVATRATSMNEVEYTTKMKIKLHKVLGDRRKEQIEQTNIRKHLQNEA